MMPPAMLRARPLFLRAAVAFVQGVALWWLYDSFDKGTWPPERLGWLVALVATAVTVPMAHYLFEKLAPVGRQLPALALLAVLTFGLGWHHGAWTANSPYFDGPLAFPVALVILVMYALPFMQSWLVRGAARPRYEDLFQFAWRNALLVALAGVFTGVFWLLLMLWGELFHMIGIELFRDLFLSSQFAIPATAVAVGTGIQLAGSVGRLQVALRQQLLTMLKWLAPLALTILALFTVALLVKTPELFVEHRRAISAAWLLSLVAMTVALLNAAYQDGGDDDPYPRWLGKGMRFAIVLLLPVALLAIYAIGVRIAAYGLTVARVWAAFAAAIAVVYAGGYAWAALRRDRWMEGMGKANIGVAFFTTASLTLMLTPVLSPERLTAGSVYDRLLAAPAPDLYACLRFDSGRYGRERLAELASIERHPEAEAIRAAATRELAKTERSVADRAVPALTAAGLEAFPAGSVIDPALIAVLGPELERISVPCADTDPCPLLFADLDGDDVTEAIVLVGNAVVGAYGSGTEWRPMAELFPVARPIAQRSREDLRRALREGRYRIDGISVKSLTVAGAQSFLWVDAPTTRRPGAP